MDTQTDNPPDVEAQFLNMQLLTPASTVASDTTETLPETTSMDSKPSKGQRKRNERARQIIFEWQTRRDNHYLQYCRENLTRALTASGDFTIGHISYYNNGAVHRDNPHAIVERKGSNRDEVLRKGAQAGGGCIICRLSHTMPQIIYERVYEEYVKPIIDHWKQNKLNDLPEEVFWGNMRISHLYRAMPRHAWRLRHSLKFYTLNEIVPSEINLESFDTEDEELFTKIEGEHLQHKLKQLQKK